MSHIKRCSTLIPIVATTTGLLSACSSEEAPRVSMPVAIDASAARHAVTTDLGYTVTLTTARAALRDLQFTIGGETHARLLDRLTRWVLPVAHAHPGHGAGGEVLGELPGRLLVDWLKEGAAMGVAVLLGGKYQGANFGFRTGEPDELPAGDPLIGHSFVFEGSVTRAGRALPFSAIVDVDTRATLVGAPFDHEVTTGDRKTLGLRLLPVDPTDSADTIWNQVDFFALEGAVAGAARITPGQESHNILVRALRTHDHYDVTHR